MKRIFIALLFVFALNLPVMAQESTEEAVVILTQEAVPTSDAVVTEGGVTIINDGGDTPTGETPVEPMPWQASFALHLATLVGVIGGGLVALRLVIAEIRRRPAVVGGLEVAWEALPDNIESAARDGAATIRREGDALLNEIRLLWSEVTDGKPAAGKDDDNLG